MRRILKIALMLVLTYCILLAGFYVGMRQSPAAFSAVMSRLPSAIFLITPFKPMWLSAREGRLKVGDRAPDFTLEAYDKRSTVQLSAFKGQKPVVLVFGSYT
jgi:AhpC/TSA family